MARRRRRNPWVSVGEILTWVLFVALLFPAGFAGWAIGHYTSLGGKKSSAAAPVTVTRETTTTVTVTTGAAATTAAATTAAATTSAATTVAATTTSAAAAAGNPTLGKGVFVSSGCGACHTFAPAGTSGTVGPSLASSVPADAQKANMPLAAFVRQSIVDPNAYVAPGYPKGVMPGSFGSQLTTTQLDDLVAFIVKGVK